MIRPAADRPADDPARDPVAAREGTVALPHPEYRALTNAVGAFEFAGVPDGDYVVVSSTPPRLESAGGAPAAALASAGDRDIRLVDLPAVTLKATLRFPDGVFPMYQLRVRDEQGAPLLDHTRPAQWTRCAGTEQTLRLPRGAHTIEVFAPPPSRRSGAVRRGRGRRGGGGGDGVRRGAAVDARLTP